MRRDVFVQWRTYHTYSTVNPIAIGIWPHFRLNVTFHQMHPAPFSRSCLPLRGGGAGGKLATLARRIPNPTASIRTSGDFAVFVSKILLPLGRCRYCLHPLWVPEFYQFVSSLPHVLLNAVFHRHIRVCRTQTHWGYVDRKHRRSFVSVEPCLLSPADSLFV